MREKAGVLTVAERRQTVGRKSEPMAVRSVRLPNKLWSRLGEALVTANVGRRQPITLSILIRGLIERGLLHPDSLDEIGSKIVRPNRILQQKATEVKRAVVEAKQKLEVTERLQVATSLFGQIKELVKTRALTYRAFLKSIMLTCQDESIFQDEMIKGELFNFYNGFISDETSISTLTTSVLKQWIEQQSSDKLPYSS